jgi:hypothetical protein
MLVPGCAFWGNISTRFAALFCLGFLLTWPACCRLVCRGFGRLLGQGQNHDFHLVSGECLYSQAYSNIYIYVYYYIIWYYVILTYITLYNVILCYIILQYISFVYFILYYIILCYFILYYIIYITLYSILLYSIVFYSNLFYYIILYYIMLYYIIYIIYIYIYYTKSQNLIGSVFWWSQYDLNKNGIPGVGTPFPVRSLTHWGFLSLPGYPKMGWSWKNPIQMDLEWI